MVKYFYIEGNEKFGPFSSIELKRQPISRTTKVWCYGMENWLEISEVPELRDVVNSIPPEPNMASSVDKKPINTEGIPMSDKGPESQIIRTTLLKNILSIPKRLRVIILITLIFCILSYVFIKRSVEESVYDKIVANSYDSDVDFNEYVDKFYRDVEYFGLFPKRPKEQIIKFSKLDELDSTTHIHGISFGFNDNQRIEIYINPRTWEEFNKPMRYFLMYHELAHDVLNVDDLEDKDENLGKLMYPSISSYNDKDMDDFIESAHSLFEEQQRINDN